LAACKLSLLALALSFWSCAREPIRPLEYVDLTHGVSASAWLPLLVALHGRGGAPERFVQTFSQLPLPARVLAMRAPIREADGGAWFVFHQGFDHALSQLHAAVPRVLATLQQYTAHHRTLGRPVVVGFSQAAMLVYQLALDQPQAFAAAFPVAGVQLGTLPRRLPRGFPPLHAFHGERDEVIPCDADARTVGELQKLGAHAQLTRVADTPHWITPEMRAQLVTAIGLALRTECSRK
jgi:phospholipase/carboxylesterase